MSQRPSRLGRAILYRLYLLSMRFESNHWLPLRRWIFDRLLGRRHKDLLIFPDVFIEDVQGLTIGDDVSINRGCNLSAMGGLTIGNDVSIAHSTSILTTEHGFSDPSVPIKAQPVTSHPVVIGDDTWIGARVCILAGVTLARSTIVGAGSVVKHSVSEENCTIAGAGEIILTDADRDGTLSGLNLELVREGSSLVEIPLVAAGGANSLEDIQAAVEAGASAVAAGAFFVFYGPHRAVLITYPTPIELRALWQVAA